MYAFRQFFRQTGVNGPLLGDAVLPRKSFGDQSYMKVRLTPLAPAAMTAMLLAFVNYLQKLWPKGRSQLRFYPPFHRHLLVNPVFVFCRLACFG
jgi:hypothetical protein